MKGGLTMSMKGGLTTQLNCGPKKPLRRRLDERPLHPYDQLRLRQCMQNNARLQQLGLPALTHMFAKPAAIHPDKNKSTQMNPEGSDSDYDLSQDGSAQQDLNDGNGKGSKEKTSYLPPGGIKFKSRKRVFADTPCTRTTRSKKSITQSDANVTPRENPMPNVGQAVELSGTYDDPTQANTEGHGLELPDDNANMTDEAERHNHIDNEGDGGNGLTLPDNPNQMTTEGEPGIRGVTMGHGLQRLSRARRGRLQVVITEGRKRPVTPLVAAKWATECNIAVRNHVAILKHWKDYENQPALIDLFMGCLRAKFDIDTTDATIKKACLKMMKNAVRQQRHKLKKKYFDPFPLHLVRKTSPVACMSNEQWIELVKSWKSPKKMETCQVNRTNRGNVKFHQTTRSRSYEIFVENDVGEKYKDEEPNAIDLFKECHYSNKKKGYTPQVQSAISQMENTTYTTAEGEQPRSAEEIVADVLGENTKKRSQFLQNMGIQSVLPTASGQNTQAELEAERRANAELRSIVIAQ